MLDKRELGQYFTEATGDNNPFLHPAFKNWASRINSTDIILEPFAGNKDLVRLLNEAGYHNAVDCYDKDPKQTDIIQRDTIVDMPSGYRFIVTNPPYLDKASAKKRGIVHDFEWFTNIYLQSIHKCLEQTEFVAAIIPLSFINSGEFREYLETVVSLNYKLFKDTEVPVCLALFRNWRKDEEDPTPCEDFTFWIGDQYQGFFSDIDFVNQYEIDKRYGKFKKNIKGGQIGLYAFDLPETRTIKFYLGEEISDDKIKESSRSITKINITRPDVDRQAIVDIANRILEEQRNSTGDIFLTPCFGLRDDKQYRQRLTFADAEYILKMALHEYDLNNGNQTFIDDVLDELQQQQLQIQPTFRIYASDVSEDMLFPKKS
jgi:hypothetical protein